MTYSTPAQVRNILQGYIDATPGDPDRTSANLTDAQIEYEISNADEQINAVLRRRYSTPLPEPVPVIIRNLSVDITAALTDLQFRGSREYASGLHPLRLRYDRALLILDRIASGEYPLYNEETGPESVGDESIVLNPYPGDVLLTREVFPRGYRPGGGEKGEYSEIEAIPYYPYLRART